jgi:hypothetical protein
MITAWILVGYLATMNRQPTPPTPAEFADEQSCEIAKRASLDLARESGLRCVKVTLARK